jgi:arsenite-transporting ATPase
VFVNQVLQKEVVEASQEDEYLKNKYQEQFGYMETIRRDLGDLVRAFIPLYPEEVANVEMVARVSNDLLRYVPAFWEEL